MAFEPVSQWARSFLEGKRYGFLHDAGDAQDTGLLRCERNEAISDVQAWLEETLKCNLGSSG
jgi:hypothetical protein